jgi:hypothetical protein
MQRNDANLQGLTCHLCKHFLRSPLECQHCEAKFCQKCLLENYQYLGNKRCPNCQVVDDFIPSSASSTLSKLHIMCSQCPQSVAYTDLDNHELTHWQCPHCSEQSSFNWDSIARHLYCECPKAPVDCKHCVFQFSRAAYAKHACKSNY